MNLQGRTVAETSDSMSAVGMEMRGLNPGLVSHPLPQTSALLELSLMSDIVLPTPGMFASAFL